jgi:hypothetical protein
MKSRKIYIHKGKRSKRRHIGANMMTRKRGTYIGGAVRMPDLYNAFNHPFDTLKRISSVNMSSRENEEIHMVAFDNVKVSLVKPTETTLYKLKLIKDDVTKSDYVCHEKTDSAIIFCKFLDSSDCITVTKTDFNNYKIMSYKKNIEDMEEYLKNQPEKRDGWSRFVRERITIDPYEYIFKNEEYKQFMNETFLKNFAQERRKLLLERNSKLTEENISQNINRKLNEIRKFAFNTKQYDGFKDVNILKLLFLFKYHYTKSMGLRMDYMEVIFWVMKKMILDIGSNQQKYEMAFKNNIVTKVKSFTDNTEQSLIKLLISLCQLFFKLGNIFFTKDVHSINENLITDIREGTTSLGGKRIGGGVENIPYISIMNTNGISKRNFSDIEEEYVNNSFVSYSTKGSLQHFLKIGPFQPIHILNKYFYFNECNGLFEEEIRFCFAKSFVDYFKILLKSNKNTLIQGTQEIYITRLLKDVLKAYYGDNSQINAFVQKLVISPLSYEEKDEETAEKELEEFKKQLKEAGDLIAKKTGNANVQNKEFMENAADIVVKDKISFPKDILKHATGLNKQLRYPDQELIKIFIEIVTKFASKTQNTNKRLSLIMLHDFVYITDFINEKIKDISQLIKITDDERRVNVEQSINITFAYNIIRIVRKTITTNGKRDQNKVNQVIQFMTIISRQFFKGMHSMVLELQNIPVAGVGFGVMFLSFIPGISLLVPILLSIPILGPITGFILLLGSLPFGASWFLYSIRELYAAFFIHLFLVYNVWLLNDKKGIIIGSTK